MCPIHPEAIEKLIVAKKLEKEAIALLLPPKVMGHLEVILGEVEAMILEVLLQRKASADTEKAVTDQTEPESKVKKVPIG